MQTITYSVLILLLIVTLTFQTCHSCSKTVLGYHIEITCTVLYLAYILKLTQQIYMVKMSGGIDDWGVSVITAISTGATKQNKLNIAQPVRGCTQYRVRFSLDASGTQTYNACMARRIIFCFCRHDDFGALPIWPWPQKKYVSHKRWKVYKEGGEF